jgi:hypothetical protein
MRAGINPNFFEVIEMENLKKGIQIGKLDICPFFYPYDYSEKTKYTCNEEVNFFYVVEYCIKGYRRCKKFTERALLERKTPEEWIEAISWGFARLDLEGCFGVYDYIRCPIYPDCEIDIVFDHFVEKCCKDFDKCDNFLKTAYFTSKPSYWARNLRIVIRVEAEGVENRDKT